LERNLGLYENVICYFYRYIKIIQVIIRRRENSLSKLESLETLSSEISKNNRKYKVFYIYRTSFSSDINSVDYIFATLARNFSECLSQSLDEPREKPV
jgi:hypothetical protein